MVNTWILTITYELYNVRIRTKIHLNFLIVSLEIEYIDISIIPEEPQDLDWKLETGFVARCNSVNLTLFCW